MFWFKKFAPKKFRVGGNERGTRRDKQNWLSGISGTVSEGERQTRKSKKVKIAESQKRYFPKVDLP